MKRREIKLYLIIFCCLSSFLVLILIIQKNIYKEREQHYAYMMSVNNHVQCHKNNHVNRYHTKSKQLKSKKQSYDKSFNQQHFTSFLKEKTWNQAPTVSYSKVKSRSSKTSLLTLSTITHNLNHSNLHIVENTVGSTHTQFESIRTHYSSVFTVSNNGSNMQLDHSMQASPRMFTLPGEETGDGPDSPDLSAPLGDHFLFLLLLSSIYLVLLKYHNRKSFYK